MALNYLDDNGIWKANVQVLRQEIDSIRKTGKGRPAKCRVCKTSGFHNCDGLRPCATCRKKKPTAEFYTRRYKDKGGEQYYGSSCKLCERPKMVARYKDKREYVDAIKLAAGCGDCGYDTHAEALEFDHRPGEEKIIAVSHMIPGPYTIEQIEAEIAKCDVRCANCHRVRTAARRSLSSD